MRSRPIVPALLLAALIAGCESDPTSPTVEIDAALSQMAAGGIGTYSTAAGSVAGVAPALPAPAVSASSCPYDAATKFFVCAPVTMNGLTFSRQFQLLDATGATLATPNPLLVASIRSVVDLEGTTTQGTAPNAATIQIDRHEDATLSGIQSANRVLNGTATQQTTVTASSLAISTNDVSTTTNLQLPSTPNSYPAGGTIVSDGTASLSSVTTSSQTYHREITFDGTSIMTVKATYGTSTTTCKVNLATPGALPTCA